MFILFFIALFLLFFTKIEHTASSNKHIFSFNQSFIPDGQYQLNPELRRHSQVFPKQVWDLEEPRYPDLILDPSLVVLKKDLHFPLRYQVTGHADLSLEALIKKFYGKDVDQLARIKYYNPSLEFREIQPGDILLIPAPDAPVNDLPNLIFKKAVPTTPHEELFDENGHIQVTAEEFDLFTRVLATEAGPNWDYKGVRMIAETITNRIRNKKANLFEVIMQEDQFSVITSGVYLTAQPSELHRLVALRALEKNEIFTPDVVFFCTEEAYAEITWFQELRVITHYGGVVFMSNQYDPKRRLKKPKTAKDTATATTSPSTSSTGLTTAKDGAKATTVTEPTASTTIPNASAIQESTMANPTQHFRSIEEIFPISDEIAGQP